MLYEALHSGKVNEKGKHGYCSIWSRLHSIILWLSASNKGYEFCFLKAGYSNLSGPCDAGVVPRVTVCVKGCAGVCFSVHVFMYVHALLCSGVNACVRGPGWERNSTNSPVVSVGSLPGSADLEQGALKRWRAQAFHSCAAQKFEKYCVNPSINHATPGSLSSPNRPLQHLPLQSCHFPTKARSCDIALQKQAHQHAAVWEPVTRRVVPQYRAANAQRRV